MSAGADLELSQGRGQTMGPQTCISNFTLKYIGPWEGSVGMYLYELEVEYCWKTYILRAL